MNLALVLAYGVSCVLQLGSNNQVAEIFGLVNDEVVKAPAKAGNRSGVVLGHGITEGDHHHQTGEVSELKAATSITGTERRLNSKPNDHNRGEGEEHALAEKSELANVLGEQLGDKAGDGA